MYLLALIALEQTFGLGDRGNRMTGTGTRVKQWNKERLVWYPSNVRRLVPDW